MSQGTFDDKSTLVQVMVWCCPATSHYLSQCRQRSLLLYGITRPPCFDTGTQTCVSELGRHWIMQVSQVPSYYLNQCYNLNRNRTLRKSDHCILFTCFENVSKQVAISVMLFTPARPKELLRKEKGQFTDIGWTVCEDTWAQHAAHNPKFQNMGSFRHPQWWHLKRLKDPPTSVCCFSSAGN